MRINLLLKRTFLLLIINLTFISFVSAQLSWYESFDYSDPLYIGGNGAAGTSSNNWTTHSVTAGQTTTIDVIVDNLSYTGLPDPTGKKILFFSNANATSRDINRAISGSTTTMYYSALINVLDNSQLSASAFDYFMAFGATSGTAVTILGARLGIMSTNSGSNFRLGICNTSGTGTGYTEFAQDLNFGTTYLVVVKYNISASPTSATLWVNPTSLGSSEPTGSVSNTSSASTFNAINSLCLRNTTTTPKVHIDEIRVGQTYADVTPAGGPDVTAPVATIAPANASTDIAINVVPTITFDEAVRNIDDSEITDANVASLITLKKTDASGEVVAFTATIDAAKKVITVTPSSPLSNSQAYYLAIGPVEDASNNASVVTTSTFTTISATAPVITLTAPLGGETFYAGQDVTFTWTSVNVTNVKIEVYIPGDGIYSEITPSTPAAAGTYAYKVPAEAGYSAAYKIKISDVANPTTCIDESDVFTVIGVATSISDLRSRFVENDIVKLNSEAIITYINGKSYYMQDANSGILMYDNGTKITTTYSQYDGITGVTGKLDDYNGVLEIIPTADAGAPTSTANIVTPLEVNIVSLNSDVNTYESRLLKIIGVTFTDAGGTFVKGTSYNFTDGVNTAVFRPSLTTDYIGTVIPKKADIICLGSDYNGTAQVMSRSLADFTVYSSVKAITAFAFNGLTPAVVGTVDETAKTVTASVPAGTVVTALVPTITVSDKATVAPLSGVATDFTSAVTYTVTAEDGTTQAYTVTVTILTGVDKNAEAVIAIGPVPAKTYLNINNIESVKLIEIFNIAGVKIETVRCEGNSSLLLSVENYKPGYYFIRFTTADGVIMKKFVKK